MSGKFNLDKLDLQIIHEMMENAEISYADLGKKLFVSGGTIHVRIKKLQEFGIVKGTRLNVNLKHLGFDVIAFIGIYLESKTFTEPILDTEWTRKMDAEFIRNLHRPIESQDLVQREKLKTKDFFKNRS